MKIIPVIKTVINERIHLGLPPLGLTDYFQFHTKTPRNFG